MSLYRKRSEDSYGDAFVVMADAVCVMITDPGGPEDDEVRVANLAFRPLDALRFARQVTKAAEAALKARGV